VPDVLGATEMTGATDTLQFSLASYFPAYRKEYESKITWEAWFDHIAQAKKLIQRSFDMFAAYWRTSDEVLFGEANHLLEQAYKKLSVLRRIVNEEDARRISCLQTYLYNLAGCMGWKR